MQAQLPCHVSDDGDEMEEDKGRAGRRRLRWPCSPRQLVTAVFAVASIAGSPGLVPYALKTGTLLYLLSSQPRPAGSTRP